MQEVKFSDLYATWKFLSKKVSFFDNRRYPSLYKILKIEPQKKKGLDFCDCYPRKKQIEDVFRELNKKWKLNNPSIVSTNPDYLEALKETIKNLKRLTVGRNFSKESNPKAKNQKKDFAEKFLKYIIDVLRYEKQKKMDIVKLEDKNIDTRVLEKDKLENKEHIYIEITESIKNGISNPKIEHIKQGDVGDCYLLSSLMSIIKFNKDKITKCFINRNTIDADKHVKIRFYKIKLKTEKNQKSEVEKVATPNGKLVVKIEKSLLQYLEKASNTWENVHNEKQEAEALWVNLIEKAFIVYKNNRTCVTSSTDKSLVDDWYEESNTYSKAGSIGMSAESIDGGYAFVAIAALTGQTTRRNMSMNTLEVKEKKFPVNGSYSDRAEAIYKLFEDKISKNKIITVATKSETFKHPTQKCDGRERTLWVDKQGNQKNYPGLFDDHIYAIVEKVETGPGILIDTETGAKTKGGTFKYICIKNPHAEEGFEEYRIEQSGKIKRVEIKNNGGKLRMELNDFLKYFESYDVSD